MIQSHTHFLLLVQNGTPNAIFTIFAFLLAIWTEPPLVFACFFVHFYTEMHASVRSVKMHCTVCATAVFKEMLLPDMLDNMAERVKINFANGAWMPAYVCSSVGNHELKQIEVLTRSAVLVSLCMLQSHESPKYWQKWDNFENKWKKYDMW